MTDGRVNEWGESGVPEEYQIVLIAMEAHIPAWELAEHSEWIEPYSVAVNAVNGAKAELQKQQAEQAKRQRR